MSELRIVFLDENTVMLDDDIDLSEIKKLGNYEGYSLLPDDDPVPYCKEAEVVILNKVKIGEKHFKQLPLLRLICEAATGYDNIDIEGARKHGIHVANVAGYATNSVVQLIFSMILAFSQKLFEYNQEVKSGEWQRSKTFGILKYHTFELAGKTIGIIGFGNIGRKVAGVAESFGMKVMPYDVKELDESGYRNYSLDEIVSRADVVVVTCPLTEKTRNLIDMGVLKKMKNSAILINTARGGIVNEKDLAEALNRGIIAGAGVDTLSKEPPVDGNPLLEDVKNLIITPHCAWATVEARQRLMNGVAENIRKYLRGETSGFIC